MDLGLRGKAAIVTGGSAGLGLAVAGELAREGCGVCICARNEERLASARREIQEASEGAVAAVRCDVERPEEIARVVEETVALFGTVHILVSNAGESLTRDFLDIRRADWERSMASVLYAAAEFSRLVIPHMRRQGWGRILMTGSTSSRQPRRSRAASNAAKAALLNFAKSLAGEFAREGILVNVVNPGRFATHWPERIARMARESGRSEEEVRAEVTKDIVMGRLGEAEEFAAAVAFLASERASYISGAALQVDGGEWGSI